MTETNISIQDAFQQQLDGIMDSFNFEKCLVALRAIKHPAAKEDRECYELRQDARARLHEAFDGAKKMQPVDHISHYYSHTGAFKGSCIICTDHAEHGSWIMLDLLCVAEFSLNDGTSFNPEK